MLQIAINKKSMKFFLNNKKFGCLKFLKKSCENYISKDQINIKGKTTEKLGVIG